MKFNTKDYLYLSKRCTAAFNNCSEDVVFFFRSVKEQKEKLYTLYEHLKRCKVVHEQ